jgi:GEVED domain
MTGNRGGASLLIAAVVLLATGYSPARADMNVYLYDPSVASDVDLTTYQHTGEVHQPGGHGFANWTPFIQRGPAPAPYPTINVWEQGFEQLGYSRTKIDGIFFVNHGTYLVPGRKALILWYVRIPTASMRNASEFHENMTLSLWVDWDQDKVWRQSERVIQTSLNLQNVFPTTHAYINVFYLTHFDVPDMTNEMASTSMYGKSGKDIRHLWTRAVVSYDDANMSPDGQQLFGDYEDYLVSYLVDRDEHGHRDDDHGHH